MPGWEWLGQKYGQMRFGYLSVGTTAFLISIFTPASLPDGPFQHLYSPSWYNGDLRFHAIWINKHAYFREWGESLTLCVCWNIK